MQTLSDDLNTQSLQALEWPALFEVLLGLCTTPYGIAAWESAPFFEEAAAAQTHSKDVDRLKSLLLQYGEPILNGEIPDISPQLKRLSKNGVLSLEELCRINQLCVFGMQLVKHVRHDQSMAMPLVIRDYLAHYLDEDHKSLKETASPRYQQLIRRRFHERQAVSQCLQGILQNTDYAGIFQSTTISEREGRSVLPVKIEYKSRLPGLTHASSGSGATLYIEPQPVIELNNRLQELEAELQQEIERLLHEISATLTEQVPLLTEFIADLSQLDKRLAGARLSKKLDANPVDILNQPGLLLRQSRHPLLILQKGKANVIANDVRLGVPLSDASPSDTRTMIITGPNTGGKTVILKTLGLCAWMLRAGLHLPVAEQSQMAFFNPILADVGDQQSLVQNLSTFSAHIAHLKSFLSETQPLNQALVLIDEIAAGTDPAEGAALARAVLEALYNRGALTVATTHLGELKVEAHQHAGYSNASVEFDPDKLQPTYRLLQGIPGSSNALTIAEKLGMPPPIIQHAQSMMKAPDREAASLIEALETKNRKLHEELSLAESLRQAAQDAKTKATETMAFLESEKHRLLKQFQSQLKTKVHALEAEMRELKEDILTLHTPENIGSRSARLKALSQEADVWFDETGKQIETVERLNMNDLALGQKFYSRQMGVQGEIIALLPHSQEVTLQAGIMRMTVPLSDLQRRAPGGKAKKRSFKDEFTQAHRNRPQPITALGKTKANEKTGLSALGNELDVRGLHGDEAIIQLDQFLDEAVIQGLKEVGVIHGLGSGALKKQIRAHLAQSQYAHQFRPADATDGGDGKTVIELR